MNINIEQIEINEGEKKFNSGSNKTKQDDCERHV